MGWYSKNMQFFQADASRGVGQLSDLLNQSLAANHRVLWLVSGGSNIPIENKVMAALARDHLSNLTIMLTDERYGDIGHANSNAQQLIAAGFSPKQAIFIPVLINQSLELTAARYNRLVSQQLERNQITIGQLGIGEDGHTAGILPNSLAATVSDSFVAYYPAQDFSRITLTFPALRLITTAIVFAYGAGKQTALKQLKDEDLPLEVQPAQILKAIPSTYIYNDELEGET